MEYANIMKGRKYLPGYDIDTNRDIIGDFVKTQTVVDYDTEKFKYGDFKDPLFFFQDPLFPIFDIILDTVSSPLLMVNGKSSVKGFLTDYSNISSIKTRQKIYDDFLTALYYLFNTDFYDIKRNKAYYINSISGLDKMTARIVDFEKDKITITMNDDISMIATYLVQLYNNLSYSYKDQRYMIPANLLRFNMYIKMHDIRNMPFIVPGNTEINSFEKSYQIYYLTDCTFDFRKSKMFEENITAGGFDASVSNKPSSLTFDITYKSIVVESEFPFLRKTLDGQSGALKLNNKRQDLLIRDGGYNSVFLNKTKSLEVWNSEIESSSSPNINNNDPNPIEFNTEAFTKAEDNTKPLYDKTASNIKSSSNRSDDLSGANRPHESIVSIVGSIPTWKPANEIESEQLSNEDLNDFRKIMIESSEYSDSEFEKNLIEYRKINIMNSIRSSNSDININGLDRTWNSSNTSPSTLERMKRSVLGQINFENFLQELPFDILRMFMGGYHGLNNSNPINTANGQSINNSPELVDEIIPDSNIEFGGVFYDPTKLKNVRIPDSIIQQGGVFSDPTNLENEIIPGSIINYGGVFYDPTNLENEIIPGSIIQQGGVFYDPTMLNKEFIPYYLKPVLPLSGNIDTSFNDKLPISGSIEGDFNVKDPINFHINTSFDVKPSLYGNISTSFNTKPPISGNIESDFNVKDPINFHINTSFDVKPPLDGNIDTSFTLNEPISGSIDTSFDPLKPISGNISTDFKVKPVLNISIDGSFKIKEFEVIKLYNNVYTQREVNLGSLYMDITKENILPLTYLFSKVSKFNNLFNYSVYNSSLSEPKVLNEISINTDIKDIDEMKIVYINGNDIIIDKTLNNIYLHGNDIIIDKTLNNIYLHNNAINSYNTLTAYNVINEIPNKEPFYVIKLDDDKIERTDLNEIYKHDKVYTANNIFNFKKSDPLMVYIKNDDAVMDEDSLNSDKITTSFKDNRIDLNMGEIYNEEITENLKINMGSIYEPTETKRLIEPIKLAGFVKKKVVDLDRLHSNSSNRKNEFKPILKRERPEDDIEVKKMSIIRVEQKDILPKEMEILNINNSSNVENNNTAKEKNKLNDERT